MAQNRKCKTKNSSTLYQALSTSGISRSCACGGAPRNRKPTTTMPKGARATHRNSKNSRTASQKQPSAVAPSQPKNRDSRWCKVGGAAGALLDIVCLQRLAAKDLRPKTCGLGHCRCVRALSAARGSSRQYGRGAPAKAPRSRYDTFQGANALAVCCRIGVSSGKCRNSTVVMLLLSIQSI